MASSHPSSNAIPAPTPEEYARRVAAIRESLQQDEKWREYQRRADELADLQRETLLIWRENGEYARSILRWIRDRIGA